METIDTVVLEKLIITSQRLIDMVTIRDSLKVSVLLGETMDAMMVRLRGYVLAEEVDNRTKQVMFRITIPATWWEQFKEDKFPNWLKRRFPVRQRTITKTKIVRFRKLATYPMANIVLKDKVGKFVYRSQIGEE